MNGKLYGIGVGPGNPELLTIKAVNTIGQCGVIAVPETSGGEKAAFAVVEKYLSGKEVLICRFSMENDMAKRKQSRITAAENITRFLESGKDVGFITLGDPTIYSTYMYIHKIVSGSGFETEIVPGVTSCSAAAAALGVPLCEGNETLTLIPASHNDNIDELLAHPGNKVIMKSGKSAARVLEILKERGYGGRTKIVCRATMDSQRLFGSIDAYEQSQEDGYFMVAIVRETI